MRTAPSIVESPVFPTFRTLLRLAFAGMVVFGSPVRGQAMSPPAAPAPIDPAALQAATDLAANFLMSQARDDGRFVYWIHLDPAISVPPRYNWLRHAGALYALSDYYHLTNRRDVVPVIERAVDYMRNWSMAPVVAIPGALAVWSDGEVTGATSPLTAKLGAAGLGLTALTALNRIKPGSVPADELNGLARFAIAMQKPDGAFYSKFIPSQGGRRDDWTSLYYPGEAALGLTELYDMDRKADWLTSARKTLHYLSESRRDQIEVPADHWALIATRRIWPYLDEADRTVFKRHTRQIVESILSEQIWDEKSLAHGGFARDGRTTPSATRLEGLMAAEFLFRDEPEFHRKLEISVSWGVFFVMKAQLKTGKYRGAVPRAIARINSLHPDARAFNIRAREVRIDYVQHALSAFIEYRTILARLRQARR